MLGTALGGIVSGVFVQLLPAPTKLVYAVFCAIFVAQAFGVLGIPETATRSSGALASMRPRLRVRTELRASVAAVTPALVGAWALTGFYGSLGPALVRKLVGSNAPALGGLALFGLAAAGVVTVLVSRRYSARGVTAFGMAALATGVVLTLLAIRRADIAAFFMGTAIAGSGFGAGFHGAIRSVVSRAAPRERAGVLSVLYVIAYLAMGLPAIVGGLRVVYGGGILATAREYGIAVVVLALVALIGTVRGAPSPETLCTRIEN